MHGPQVLPSPFFPVHHHWPVISQSEKKPNNRATSVSVQGLLPFSFPDTCHAREQVRVRAILACAYYPPTLILTSQCSLSPFFVSSHCLFRALSLFQVSGHRWCLCSTGRAVASSLEIGQSIEENPPILLYSPHKPGDSWTWSGHIPAHSLLPQPRMAPEQSSSCLELLHT